MAIGKNEVITARLYRFTKKSIEYELVRPPRTHPQVPSGLPTPLTIHAADPDQKFRQRCGVPMLITLSGRGRIIAGAAHEPKQDGLSFYNKEKERRMYMQEDEMFKDVLLMFFFWEDV